MERDIEKMVCDCLQEAVDEACKAWSADGRCAALDKDAQGCMAAPGQCRARRWRDALEMAKRRLEEEDLLKAAWYLHRELDRMEDRL